MLSATGPRCRFIPVPGFGAGDLVAGPHAHRLHRPLLIPGRLYAGDRDPEGLFGTIPAIATCLAGVVTGHLLKATRFSGYAKTAVMIARRRRLPRPGWLWTRWQLLSFPINKNLWSSSFVLHCAGWSLLFLAMFYLVIDVLAIPPLGVLFIVIGSNSILIYMAAGGSSTSSHTTHFFFDGALKFTRRLPTAPLGHRRRLRRMAAALPALQETHLPPRMTPSPLGRGQRRAPTRSVGRERVRVSWARAEVREQPRPPSWRGCRPRAVAHYPSIRERAGVRVCYTFAPETRPNFTSRRRGRSEYRSSPSTRG